MATQYAKFAKGEFNHVDKNLAVVDYYLTAKAAQDAMLIAKRKHELAIDAQSKSTGAMLEKLRSRLVELTTPSIAGSNLDAAQTLRSAATRMQGISGTPDMQRRATKDVVLTLLPLFCKFDVAAFDKASADIVAENALLVSEVAKASGARGAATGKYNAAIKNWANVFSDTSFITGDTDLAKAECAYNAATRFVDVWRQRARCYLTTVTIEGTSIGTLSPEIRDIWTRAYNKLKFNELKRADLYIPYRHEYSLRSNRKEVLNG